MRRQFFHSLLVAGSLLAGAAGCNRTPTQTAAVELIPVPVAQPVQRKVTDFVDYTGRTNARVNVVIQARVTGYLKEMPFREGAHVKEGDILFKIDPRIYEGQYIAAKDQVK